MWEEILRGSLVGGITMSLIYALSQFRARTKPSELKPEGGKIAISKPLILILVLISTLVASAFIYYNIFHDGEKVSLISAGGFLFLAALLATFLRPVYDITWDETSVTGPCTNGMWPLGPQRMRMPYHEIAKYSGSAEGLNYIMNDVGTKIRWNYAYSGYVALNMAVLNARPDLRE